MEKTMKTESLDGKIKTMQLGRPAKFIKDEGNKFRYFPLDDVRSAVFGYKKDLEEYISVLQNELLFQHHKGLRQQALKKIEAYEIAIAEIKRWFPDVMKLTGEKMTLRSLNCKGCGQTFPTIESLIIHEQSCSKLENRLSTNKI